MAVRDEDDDERDSAALATFLSEVDAGQLESDVEEENLRDTRERSRSRSRSRSKSPKKKNVSVFTPLGTNA